MQVRPVILAAIFAAVISLPFAAFAQAVSSATAVHTITLEVEVSDASGNLVKGLAQQDFKLMDNKDARNLSAFREAVVDETRPDPPTEAVLLIDAISTPLTTLSDLRRNISVYLNETGAHLPVPTSLVFLTGQGLKSQAEPTQDPKVLLTNLENNPIPQQIQRRAEGYTYDAEVRQKSLTALGMLAIKLSQKPGRKLIIWIGPGWGAFEEQTAQKSRKELEDLFTYVASLSTALREAGVTLYSVDPTGTASAARADTRQYEAFVRGGTSLKDVDNGDLMLPVLVTQSGGLVLYGNNNIAQLIGKCLADSQSFYQIKFDAPPATKVHEFHRLEVLVDKPGLKARTRTRYYIEP